jgi:hypothetical protein
MEKVLASENEEVEVATQEELYELLPRVLPASWRALRVDQLPFSKWYQTTDGLRVCVSMARERDSCCWLHVSISREKRLPSWEELKLVKDVIIGPEKTALQVLPPKSKYVNKHAFCLHLWHNLDREVVPDFTRGGQV